MTGCELAACRVAPGSVYPGRAMTYLDHAATTPILPEAAAVLTGALSAYGNASSLHSSGRRARRAVEEARESIAAALGARPSEVVFTSGGTESDNLAVKGIYWARRAADPRRVRVLVSSVEHHAVLDAALWLAEHDGAEVTLLEVDDFGRVHEDTLRAAIAEDPEGVALVSVMWANNEVGTVNPVRELATTCAAHGIPFHTDAVQAVGALPVDFNRSGASALTLSGHKVGGPFGVGALLLRRDVTCAPVSHGGGQERDVRSGTLDVPAIVAMATAVRLATEQRVERAARLAALRADLVRAVRAVVPAAQLNGDPGESEVDGGPSRLPGNAHFSFPGCEGDSLLMLLDARGIECSTGSACTAGVAQPSHVLLAMGVEPAPARGSLRFSLGHTSTAADVAALAEAIGPVVERARNAGLAGLRRGASHAEV
ncbi:cysteine desulfurase [Actinokineospora terrae]|uniref:Cysteine desulfurase n=2 Tax=Actinokineospora terrae TaxID=155974 RepID=A0A1H9QHZ7_9PSEU|nr:cysteine desulfurase [Actinokineospora terrae]